jgi:predicted DsbA family dithiol-disulfide isomerase
MARFTAALDQHTHEVEVKAESAAASAIGINGTPGFLINDYYLSGAQDVGAFRRLIRRALADAKKK